jgi:hypothetical protein
VGRNRWEIPQGEVLWRGTPELFRQPNYMQLTGFKQIYVASVWLARALVYLMPNSEARKKAFARALVELGAWATP